MHMLLMLLQVCVLREGNSAMTHEGALPRVRSHMVEELVQTVVNPVALLVLEFAVEQAKLGEVLTLLQFFFEFVNNILGKIWHFFGVSGLFGIELFWKNHLNGPIILYKFVLVCQVVQERWREDGPHVLV